MAYFEPLALPGFDEDTRDLGAQFDTNTPCPRDIADEDLGCRLGAGEVQSTRRSLLQQLSILGSSVSSIVLPEPPETWCHIQWMELPKGAFCQFAFDTDPSATCSEICWMVFAGARDIPKNGSIVQFPAFFVVKLHSGDLTCGEDRQKYLLKSSNTPLPGEGFPDAATLYYESMGTTEFQNAVIEVTELVVAEPFHDGTIFGAVTRALMLPKSMELLEACRQQLELVRHSSSSPLQSSHVSYSGVCSQFQSTSLFSSPSSASVSSMAVHIDRSSPTPPSALMALTGVSQSDERHTLASALEANTDAADFSKPFPLLAHSCVSISDAPSFSFCLTGSDRTEYFSQVNGYGLAPDWGAVNNVAHRSLSPWENFLSLEKRFLARGMSSRSAMRYVTRF